MKTLENEDSAIDPLDMKDGLSRILDLGLIETEEQGDLVLHRLLAAYVQHTPCMDAEAQKAVETTLGDEARRINKSGLPAGLLVWQAHLSFAADQAMAREDETGAQLCNELGYHLHSMGDYQVARPYYEKALEIRKKVLGDEHPDTAKSLNNLAMLCYDENDFEEAARLMRQALAIYRKVLGDGHPDTKTMIANLEAIEQKLNDPTET